METVLIEVQSPWHLKLDYCNRGQLGKVDQLDYRKITITFQESWSWANQQLVKKNGNKLLKAQI